MNKADGLSSSEASEQNTRTTLLHCKIAAYRIDGAL
jgi:hypothetical protein